MAWDMVYNVIVASGDSLSWVPCCSLLNHVLLQLFWWCVGAKHRYV